MHICMCLENMGQTPPHCDCPVGSWMTWIWFVISPIHRERWWDCGNLALFPFSYFSPRFLSLLSFWKPLYSVVVSDVANICFVYLALSSFTLLLKAACVFFFFCFPFLWSDAFYQSNRLAAVFEWPGPHTHTHTPHNLYRLKTKCTDNQRERGGGRGGIGPQIGPV